LRWEKRRQAAALQKTQAPLINLASNSMQKSPAYKCQIDNPLPPVYLSHAIADGTQRQLLPDRLEGLTVSELDECQDRPRRFVDRPAHRLTTSSVPETS